MRTILAAFVLAAGSLAVACEPADPDPCRTISTRCHPYDNVSTLGHECHELGHARGATREMCQARRAECLAACPPTDASAHTEEDAGDSGAGGDAGGTDAATDGTVRDPMACRTISSRCHPYDNGPDAGVPYECHELGHGAGASNEQCLARYDECLAACPPTDGGASHGDGGGGDH